MEPLKGAHHGRTDCQAGEPAPDGRRNAHRHRPSSAARRAKSEFAAQNWYDVWFPNLAPSLETMKLAQAAETPAQWAAFAKKYRAEMTAPEHSHAIKLLATLSRQSNFSVGCYCENEAHCHRSILRALLAEAGAVLAAPDRSDDHPPPLAKGRT